LGFDILGSAFFMLTRYEEIVRPDRDEHDNFPASASVAAQEGFLERPIVNEYLEILWAALFRLWPNLERKARRSRLLLSHDVDVPFNTIGRTMPEIVRSLAADIFRRSDPGLAVRRSLAPIRALFGDREHDPANTFDWIMTQSERYGLRSAFYFNADSRRGKFESYYRIDDPWFLNLMRQIHQRGHEIGVHPSYLTYRDPAKTAAEVHALCEVASAAGVSHQAWGGRQHYLRWANPVSWRNWESAGLAYDSSLGFNARVGFRCGVCYEYPAFDLLECRPIQLRERPLIAMDVTLLNHMGYSAEIAQRVIVELHTACRRFDGDFTLLWHNNYLVSRRERALYSAVLDAIAGERLV
jgi:hypothetical protein